MNKKGFTLTELIAVILIISIIISLSIVTFFSIRKNILQKQYDNLIIYLETKSSLYAEDTGELNVTVERLIETGYVVSNNNEILDPRDNKIMNCFLFDSKYENNKYISKLNGDLGVDESGKCNDYVVNKEIQICVDDGTGCKTKIQKWYNKNVTLKVLVGGLEATEGTKVTWKANGEAKSQLEYETSVSLINQGIYTVEVSSRVENTDGTVKVFEGTDAIQLNIDLEKPLIKKIKIEKEKEWNNINKEVTINIIDNNGSGISAIAIFNTNLDCQNSNVIWEEYNNLVYTNSYYNGTYYVCAKDNAGNISEKEQFSINNIDLGLPNCKLNVIGTKVGNWYIEYPRIELEIINEADVGGKKSDIIAYGLSKNDKKYYNFKDSITINSNLNGVTYYGYVKDAATNEGSCEETIYVDNVSPTVSIVANKVTSGTAVATNTWSDEGLKFTLTKGTTGSSGYTIYYCKDTANTCNPETIATSGTTITSYTSTTGTYYIRYKIVSGAGKSSSVGSYIAKVDNVSPTVSIVANKVTSGTAVATNTWSDEGLKFTLTKGTTGSSDYTIYYCKDTVNTCNPGTTATSGTAITSYTSTTGTYYIRYKIVGGSGKSSSVGSYIAKVDNVSPTVSIVANKATSGTTVASNTLSDEGLKFTLTKGTTGSSGYTIYYCKDTANTCNPETIATSGTAITSYTSTTGTYYIRYKIVGGSGKSSSVGSYIAKVELEKPEVSISAYKNQSGTSVSSGSWSSEGLKFTLTTKKCVSNDCKIYYCKDTANTCNPGTIATSGTAITSYTSITGTYYIRYKITTGSGKSSNINSYTAKVDRTTPSFSITAKKVGSSTIVTSDKWSNEALLYTITTNSVGASGINYYYCYGENNTCNPNTLISTSGTTFTIDTLKARTTNYNLSIVAISNAGLKSSISTFKAKFDLTPPKVTYWHYYIAFIVPIFQATVVDQESGVDAYAYVSNPTSNPAYFNWKTYGHGQKNYNLQDTFVSNPSYLAVRDVAGNVEIYKNQGGITIITKG